MGNGWSEEWLASHQAKQGKDAFQALIESKGFNPVESVDHLCVARYLDALNLFWLHIVNEGKRKGSTGAKLKAMGMKAGASDFLIFDAPPLYPCAKGVALELKRTKGGTVQDNQNEFLGKLKQRGWITAVTCGASETLEFLRGLGWRIEGSE